MVYCILNMKYELLEYVYSADDSFIVSILQDKYNVPAPKFTEPFIQSNSVTYIDNFLVLKMNNIEDLNKLFSESLRYSIKNSIRSSNISKI